MKRILLSGVGLIVAIGVAAPALADEPVPPPQQVKRVKRAKPAPRAAEPVRQVRREPVRQEPARQPSSGKSWSGSQLGGSNGGSFASNNFVEPGSYVCPPYTYLGHDCFETPFSFKESQPAYTFGGYYGYNIQLGNFVVGLEGDASYQKAETSITRVTETSYYPSGYYYVRSDSFNGKMTQGWGGAIRGRFGMLITPSLLVYGTGGVAFGKVSGSLSYTGTVTNPNYDDLNCNIGSNYSCGTTTSYTSFSETRVGATGGFGVEMQVGGPWTARLEYRYTDLGKFTKTFPVSNGCVTCGDPSSGASIELHPTSQTIQFGLSADPRALLSRLFSPGSGY